MQQENDAQLDRRDQQRRSSFEYPKMQGFARLDRTAARLVSPEKSTMRTHHAKEAIMRFSLFAALIIASSAGIMTFESSTTNAAVACVRGVVRAGCVATGGVAVVRRPVAACRYVIVNGVRVRRCV